MNTARWLDQDFPQDLQEQFSATPPRIDFGQQVSNDIIWETAVEWVTCHRHVILKAGAPVLKAGYMDQDDLLQTAYLLAMEQCQRVMRQGKPDEFVPLFFGHLRGVCLALWQRHHHIVATDLDWDNVPDPNPVDCVARCDGIDPRVEREKAMTEALEFMTERQRNVMKVLLGVADGRGSLGIREAAAWFEVAHRTIQETIERACCRVAQGKMVHPKNSDKNQQDDRLHSRLVQLEKRNAALLQENLSLRRQLGRPVING